ncbi:MAG TPA: hypothetical protein VGX23_20255 [Actinocrinis sp.]|nr:hypothetical protein [Actinocrinis sp.]
MPTDNELLTAELETMAEETRLGRGVSAQRALAEGHRILRRRRVIGTTGGIGASGLALLLAVLLLPVHGRAGGGGTGLQSGPADALTAPAATRTGPGDVPASGGPPGTAPGRSNPAAGSDPLVAPAVFGWLPAGFTVNGYNDDPAQPAGDIGPGAGTYRSVYEISAQTPDGEQKASLAVLPAGLTPVSADTVGASPAPAVGGGAAYWQTAPADQAPSAGEVILDWQYGTSTWAELSLTLGSGAAASPAQTQDVALHMAQEVQFGGSLAIALPFRHVTGPAGLTTVTAGEVELNPGIIADATWAETLCFANGPRPTGGDAADSGYSSLEIGVTAAELPAADAGFTDDLGGTQETANTTVAGFPATLITSPGYTLLTVDNAKGFGTIEIQGTGAQAAALAVPGAAAAVFDQLQLLGADKAKWTTDVAG